MGLVCRPPMPSAFDFSISPFDALSLAQQHRVRAALELADYRPGQVILEAGASPAYLWVNFKGHVAEYEDSVQVGHLGPQDVWDGRALVAGRSSHRFVATEDVIAYQVPRELVMSLIAENATFGALLFADFSAKLSALDERVSAHDMQSLTLSRVDEVFLRPAPEIDADADVLSAVRLLHTHAARALLVRDRASNPPRLGLFAGSTVQRAVLDGRPLPAMAVREFSRFPLVTVRPEDTLGDALALLVRHRIHRLVVAEGQAVRGFLEALDVFSFLANHSQQIALQIELAESIAALALASAQITRMVERLYRSGTRVALIARLVHVLQARLFERAWQLIAPPKLLAHSCLFVMGSEGRGEQLLKTDQDNGLLLQDGYEPPADLPAVCEAFSRALADFGYPPCPGGVMISRPAWRGTVAQFRQRVRQWLSQPSAQSLMQLAILLDAQAVAGDPTLLALVQGEARQSQWHSDAFLARFACAVDASGPPQGWWGRLFPLGHLGHMSHLGVWTSSSAGLNLKKAGIFTLVHGTRALALQAGLSELGTAARLQALAARGVVTFRQAEDWTQCLHFLMGLKLQAGLDELARGQPVSGMVMPMRLSTLERDLLKDALGVVRQFREDLHRRFPMDML